MRRVCSVCGKKEALLFGGAYIIESQGICYCSRCYEAKYAGQDPHPIPGSLIKGQSGAVVEFPAEGEYYFSDRLVRTPVRIHRLMYYPLDPQKAFSYDCFLGLDLNSGKPVLVSYSEDETPSDGGPSYVSILPLEPRQYSNVLSYFPLCIQEKLRELNAENWQSYRNVSVRLDMAIRSFTLCWDAGAHVKIVRFSKNEEFLYAEVSREAYAKWLAGKDPVERAVCIEELRKDAPFQIYCGLCPTLMKKWKLLLENLENCCNAGSQAEAQDADCIRLAGHSRELDLFKIPQESLDGLVSYIESMFPKNFATRTSLNPDIPKPQPYTH